MSSLTTVQLFDENFSYSFSEDLSNYVGAVYCENLAASGATLSLLTQFGNTADNDAGYMLLTKVSDWINKYNNTYKGICGSIGVKNPDPIALGGQCNAAGASPTSCYNGATGTLAKYWWSVHNFLQYGGKCIIAGDSGTWTQNTNPLLDKGKFPDIDVVFALDHSETQANIIKNIVIGRNYDCFGVVGVSGEISGYGEPINGVGGQTAINITPQGVSLGQYGMAVYGNKLHFGLNQNLNTVTSPLVADAAGCLIRTDRDFYPWYSPAGFNRGKVLNAIRLETEPSESSQNHLTTKNVNFFITVSGQGSFLFSDKTLLQDTSNPYRFINVSRLLIYLIKNIGPIAKRYLFEFNNELTRLSFTNNVEPILNEALASGGLTDYTIVCDESNNTPDIIAQNKFIADVTITSAIPIMTINLRFTNLNT